MLIDSHCHLHLMDLTEYDGEIANVLAEAFANDVTHFLSVAVELGEFAVLKKLAELYSEISISVGVHPNTVMDLDPETEDLIQLGQYDKCIAIGETGLDYYRTETDSMRAMQQERFRRHIRAAKYLSKPLIIHTRQAAEDTIQILKEEKACDIGGVMHCFSEDWDVAQQALDLNFYISFSGIVTFKNATVLQDVAKKVPLDRILIETDAPYLAPVPHRGKANRPAWVKHVAEYVSQLRGLSLDEFASLTTNNFKRCFFQI